MKLVLKDGNKIELSNGNNQNQFVVSYIKESELISIEALLTNENLSDAKYMIDSEVVETLKNKVLSGSKRNIITHKATYYLVDAKSAEMEQLQAKVSELEEKLAEERSKASEGIELLNQSLNDAIDELMTEVLPSIEDLINNIAESEE